MQVDAIYFCGNSIYDSRKKWQIGQERESCSYLVAALSQKSDGILLRSTTSFADDVLRATTMYGWLIQIALY
jgi:hypothetical protein